MHGNNITQRNGVAILTIIFDFQCYNKSSVGTQALFKSYNFFVPILSFRYHKWADLGPRT